MPPKCHSDLSIHKIIWLLNNKLHGLSPYGGHHSLLFDQEFQKLAGWDWSEPHLMVIGTPSDSTFHGWDCTKPCCYTSQYNQIILSQCGPALNFLTDTLLFCCGGGSCVVQWVWAKSPGAGHLLIFSQLWLALGSYFSSRLLLLLWQHSVFTSHIAERAL